MFYTAALIKKSSVIATIYRLRECVVFELIVKNLDSTFVTEVAGEGYITLRDSLRARIDAVASPLSELYSAAATVLCECACALAFACALAVSYPHRVSALEADFAGSAAAVVP